MVKFFTHTVFPLLVSAIVASMVALTLYFAKQHGRLYLTFLLAPAIITFFVYRKEDVSQ